MSTIDTFEQAAQHNKVVKSDMKGSAIHIKPYANCTVINALMRGNLRIGNVAVSDDGNIKVNIR